MIDAKRLLDDLKRRLRRLETDLLERADTVAEMRDALQQEYQAAQAAGRTGEAFATWREGVLTQAAVAWLLGCVFVRFLEDNGLVAEALLSGTSEQRQGVRDRQLLYFQQHPTDNDRDYLYEVFRTVQQLPAMAELFDAAHNPVWAYGISAYAAKELIEFWQQADPDTGVLAHDFTDATWNTRFLGDLYQDLSEDARKRYALLQTPDFVEAFILDRTLEPAIAEFGLSEVRLLDPTCGSGHFLLGAFQRLLRHWFQAQPGIEARKLVQLALDAVHGVDVNPYAVAIARFRLLVAALRVSEITALPGTPGFRLNLAVGDSLLHGQRFGELALQGEAVKVQGPGGMAHVYRAEDLRALNRILGQQYHVVVGNPPYITVKDRGLNQAYRERFTTCHRQYSLGVPFTQRFFELAVAGPDTQPAGYVGMITANSFMKREFGKKLIEVFFPRVDLTHVLDTSGAYIPGHGTPTVVLFGRHRAPVSREVRAVLGIRGEPSTPEEPAQGLVWRSIVEHVDQQAAQNEFVSVTDIPRTTFAKHPWSIGGGGAADLKTTLDNSTDRDLSKICKEIGFGAVTREDEAYLISAEVAIRHKIPESAIKPLVIGEEIRDWIIQNSPGAIWPYDPITLQAIDSEPVQRFLWPWKKRLSQRTAYGSTQLERGLTWYEYSMFFRERFRTPLSIAFAFVATHNHFVLDRGGKVFKQTAPIIKLPPNATEEEHLALLGLLNSSTACFWGRQVFFPRGGFAAGKWEERLEWDGTKLQKFPIPTQTSTLLPQALDKMANEYCKHLPSHTILQGETPKADVLDNARSHAARLLRSMIATQEELDWQCYRLYGLTDHNLEYQGELPEIELSQRAFEILMARKMAAGALETTWFERHRSTPITALPEHWPDDYKRLVERRIALIESDTDISLIEQPEYKRRWNTEPWKDQEQRALRQWLLDRLESNPYWPSLQLQTTRSLANTAQLDADFMRVAELYRGHAGFDVPTLVAELAESAAVPFLPILRYKPSGLRKREVWQHTWERQRQEDAIDANLATTLTQREDETAAQFHTRRTTAQQRRKQEAIGDIPPPPKYQAADFLSATFWRLRGALDVPKERCISYPFCARESDTALVLGWAGWDHLQQAQALAAWYTEIIEQEGWTTDRLKPLLAGIAELLPWLTQWHNEIDPDYDTRMGDFFAGFLQEQLQRYSLTREDLATWTPPATKRARKRRTTSS